ncbi:MAG: hypothetical protein AMXMBFR53_28710 [Gemmatimonadota bacterium]
MDHRPKLLAAGAALVGLAVLVALGPRARVRGTVQPVEPEWDVEAWLARGEGRVAGLRPGDGKAVVWADPEAPSHTPLAVVYLHGFSADRHEISPVPERVAAALGANLFLTRLTGHGRDGAALAEATALDWLQDTEEALAVGTRLGTRVVLVGASTGATLALWAAAQERWRERLAALVLVSPNLGPRDDSAEMLLWPWGGVLARLAVGSERCFPPLNEGQARHWTTCYPTRALLPMMALVDHVRGLDPGGIRAPLLVLYAPHDQVVDARRTEALFPLLGSRRKELLVVEGSDDPAHHVLAGDIVSPGTTDAVVTLVVDFLKSLESEEAR